MNKNLKLTTFLLIITVFILLAGCDRPAVVPTETQDLDAVFTSVAQTIIAGVTTPESATQAPAEGDGHEPTQEPPPPEPADTEPPPPPDTPIPTDTPFPTETPEPSPTPTPTSTPTITPIPNAIYEDDFSDTERWYKYEGDQWSFKYGDGGYHIFNDILAGVIWSIRGQEYTDVHSEVDGTRVAGPSDGYYGVICRLSDEGENYYALVIGDDGFYGIAKMKDGEYEFLDEGEDEDDIINLGLDATNRVRGDCIGSTLTLYANGLQLMQVVDGDLTKGDIGLVAGNKASGTGVDILFDNYAVLSP